MGKQQMQFQDSDYEEILNSLRDEIRLSNLSFIDEKIFHHSDDANNSRDALEKYMKALTDQIQLGSDEFYVEVLNRFQKYIDTDDGKRIDGVKVFLTDSEMKLYKSGENYFDLSNIDNETKRILRDLKQISEELGFDDSKWGNQK